MPMPMPMQADAADSRHADAMLADCRSMMEMYISVCPASDHPPNYLHVAMIVKWRELCTWEFGTFEFKSPIAHRHCDRDCDALSPTPDDGRGNSNKIRKSRQSSITSRPRRH